MTKWNEETDYSVMWDGVRKEAVDGIWTVDPGDIFLSCRSCWVSNPCLFDHESKLYTELASLSKDHLLLINY